MDEATHRAKLNFSGFSGYYGYMSYYDGYGGFNFQYDFLYMNQSTWTDPNGVGYEEGWCDTGYQNVAAMSQAKSLAWVYEYGVMESASRHSFTLTAMNVASSFSNDAVWNVISYTENNGALKVKAVDQLTVSYTGEHVKLAALGQPGDFQNIAAVAFEMVSYGSPGNTCTYGYGVIGQQLAIGAVNVKFSKTANLGNRAGKLPTPWMLHHASHAIAHPGATQPHVPGADQHVEQIHAHDGQAQLSWPAHDFHPPVVDHFL